MAERRQTTPDLVEALRRSVCTNLTASTSPAGKRWSRRGFERPGRPDRARWELQLVYNPRGQLEILRSYRRDLLRMKILDAERNHAIDQCHSDCVPHFLDPRSVQ